MERHSQHFAVIKPAVHIRFHSAMLPPTTKLFDSVSRLHKAWSLLDRQAEKLKHPKSTLALPPEEQTALLNGVLKTWRKSVGNRLYMRVEKRDAIEESNYVLSRFDGNVPLFQPNTASYNNVLIALNRFNTSK